MLAFHHRFGGSRRRSGAALALGLLLAAGCAQSIGTGAGPEAAPQATVWRFDQLRTIGGRPVRAEGQPQIVPTEIGGAVAFDGADDAVYLDAHPLAGARTFTIEAIFRPDGGAFEQRWLHLAEAGEVPPEQPYPPVPRSGPRLLFEIRVVKDRWYLDAFAAGPGYRHALMFPEKTFPIGRWYHVAQAYDGKTYRSYVDGVLQGEQDIAFAPQGPGHSSVGTRIDRRDYFKGAVYAARFTRDRALRPDEFMRFPRQRRPRSSS